jgi:hypothetical protein
MKTIALMGIFCFVLSMVSLAQVVEPITMEKKGLKKIYMQKNETLDSKQLASILTGNEASVGAYKASKTYSIVGLTTLAIGTVAIGVGFYNTLMAAQATNDNDLVASTEYSDKSNTYMLTGAGFYVITVPFMLLSNSSLKKSINLYNASGNTGMNNIDLHLGFTTHGAGLQLTF